MGHLVLALQGAKFCQQPTGCWGTGKPGLAKSIAQLADLEPVYGTQEEPAHSDGLSVLWTPPGLQR